MTERKKARNSQSPTTNSTRGPKFGLAREGHLNKRGMPHPLQLALFADQFSDVIVFRRPPAAVQRLVFGALAPIARRRGYRPTYPGLSRATLAPRAISTAAKH